MLQRQCTCGTETFHMYKDIDHVIFKCTDCGKIVMSSSFYVDNNCEFVRS